MATNKVKIENGIASVNGPFGTIAQVDTRSASPAFLDYMKSRGIKVPAIPVIVNPKR